MGTNLPELHRIVPDVRHIERLTEKTILQYLFVLTCQELQNRIYRHRSFHKNNQIQLYNLGKITMGVFSIAFTIRSNELRFSIMAER